MVETPQAFHLSTIPPHNHSLDPTGSTSGADEPCTCLPQVDLNEVIASLKEEISEAIIKQTEINF